MGSRVNERYVVDRAGKPVSVILDINTYREMLEELEELAAVRAYDAAKASEDEVVPFEQVVEEIERARQ